MQMVPHIALGLLLASPAAALTPVPMCSGAPVERSYPVWDAQNAENGFVTYVGEKQDGSKALVVLEHCKSGRALLAQARWSDVDADADHLDNVRDAMDDFVYATQSYSFRQIKAGLKQRGIKARIKTLKEESCGCAKFYPQARGNRTPYQ